MNSRLSLAIFAIATILAPLAAQDQETEFVTVYGAQLPELDPQKALFSNEDRSIRLSLGSVHL